MKTKILNLALLAIMAGTIVISCGEASKKDMKAAKADTKEVGKDLLEAGKDAKAEVETAVKANWKSFKSEADIAIAETEKDIKDLRAKISKTAKNEREKLNSNLDILEEKNEALKQKLEKRGQDFKQDIIEFNDDAKEKEQSFEREFNHDLDELGTALKDIFKNNVE